MNLQLSSPPHSFSASKKCPALLRDHPDDVILPAEALQRDHADVMKRVGRRKKGAIIHSAMENADSLTRKQGLPLWRGRAGSCSQCGFEGRRAMGDIVVRVCVLRARPVQCGPPPHANP